MRGYNCSSYFPVPPYAGYFSSSDARASSAADREEALRREIESFQRAAHLPVTGTMNAATLRALRVEHGS